MFTSKITSSRFPRMVWIVFAVIGVLLAPSFSLARDADAGQEAAVKTKTIEIPFRSHDGYEMFGKLTLPETRGRHGVVIYVQTAEGMTVDMKRRDGRGGTFNYFDLYRKKLPEMNVAFFGYEGRGIQMGESPPRYEKIDWEYYDTSTLENKVRDVISAVRIVQKQAGVDKQRIFLMGASEGTLLAAEAASRLGKEIAGLILYGVLSANMRENFRYIMTGGAFLAYLGYFDTDKDGRISKAEFEADPKKYREAVFKNAPFGAFDRNGDGFWTVDETRFLTKVYLDAIDEENYEVLNRWVKTAAGVSTPKDWFKDHFAHQPIWTFLAKLDAPIGFFQGSADAAAPIEGVKKLEEEAKKAGKSKMEFHYFDGLDHTLGIGAYFVKGTLAEGHKAIFEFIKRHTEKK